MTYSGVYVDDCPLSEIENGILRRNIENHVGRKRVVKPIATIVSEVFVVVYRGPRGTVLEEHIEAAIDSHSGIAS
jgi:hypothetical protein